MKNRYKARDGLYETMDGLISFFKLNRSQPQSITLNSKQFQLFKEFNKPENNAYFYKKNLIREL